MKFTTPLAVLILSIPFSIAGNVVAPVPGAVLAPGQAFKFEFSPSLMDTGELTNNLTLSLNFLRSATTYPLGALVATPWAAKLVVPATATPGVYQFRVVEQLVYSFTGFPSQTKIHNTRVYVESPVAW